MRNRELIDMTTHTNVMDMEASILTLSLLALRMVPSIVDTAVQINNAFVVSLSVCQIVSSKYQIRNVFVKLRRGSGKDRQGMAPKAKGLQDQARA